MSLQACAQARLNIMKMPADFIEMPSCRQPLTSAARCRMTFKSWMRSPPSSNAMDPVRSIPGVNSVLKGESMHCSEAPNCTEPTMGSFGCTHCSQASLEGVYTLQCGSARGLVPAPESSQKMTVSYRDRHTRREATSIGMRYLVARPLHTFHPSTPPRDTPQSGFRMSRSCQNGPSRGGRRDRRYSLEVDTLQALDHLLQDLGRVEGLELVLLHNVLQPGFYSLGGEPPSSCGQTQTT